jgi:DNA helicase IV
MRLPTLAKLTPEQTAVFMNAPLSSILVVGPPGTGKTSCALWKARIVSSSPYSRNVIVVTRNRLLAALASHISQDHGGAPVESSTMHKVLAKDFHARSFGSPIPKVEEYVYDWDQIITMYDAAGAQPTVDHLIVDEGQNLPIKFFVWARRFLAKEMSVFADEDQTTDVGGSKLAEFKQAGYTGTVPLTQNHRNSQEIADLVACFHVKGRIPAAPAQRGKGSDVPQLLAVSSWQELAVKVMTRLQNQAVPIGVILYKQRHINEFHAVLMKLAPADARVDSYTSESPRGVERAIMMREKGITVISGESATGLEFNVVYLQDLDRSLPMTVDVDYRRLYMLCSRARDSLILVNGPTPLTPAQLAALPPPPILDR